MGTDPAPTSGMTSAAPPVLSRVLAFLSVLVGGLCGGLIGYGFVDLQCEGDCTAWLGTGAIVGAVAGAVGVAIVAVLALRAMDEWQTIKDRDEAEAHRARAEDREEPTEHA
ncbi:MAG: hypothetical protein OEU32_02855 [Acidimicrobiia bacterium]|nr:hypothetical protein [Acidimicrobiia bacterium]